jgi:hypothetical protein
LRCKGGFGIGIHSIFVVPAHRGCFRGGRRAGSGRAGRGEQAQATAGRQTIGFDGEKIVFGQFAGDLKVAGPLAAVS